MQDRLVGKHIDLGALSELVREFFDSRNFRVSVEKQPSEFRIVALAKSGSDLCDSIEVLIRGNSDDFAVLFGESEGYTRKFTWYGGLTTILGGGVFLKKGLRSQEELDRLENDFWSFFDSKLVSLERK